MTNTRLTICLLLLLVITACQSREAQSEPSISTSSTGSLGDLDPFYDRKEWQWVNIRGQNWLQHRKIDKCYVAVDSEPLGFEGAEEEVSYAIKTIGDSRYQVTTVIENGTLWAIIYGKDTSWTHLAVYASGACQVAAENILYKYESSIKHQ